MFLVAVLQLDVMYTINILKQKIINLRDLMV